MLLLGRRIKELRKQKGLTQEALGNLINVTKVSISGYEKGKRTPNIETLIDIADTLEVSVNYLLGQDIKVVSEAEHDYCMVVAREDIEIIRTIKKYRSLYENLLDNPENTIKLMNKKIK